MCAKRKLHRSISWRRSGPSYTPYGGGESTSTAIAPTSTSQDTSMAIATQPCLSIHCSASFVVYICVPSVNYTEASHGGDQGLPTHHMVAESRPLQLYLPLRLVRTPLWQ